jgi:hypothetical protein
MNKISVVFVLFFFAAVTAHAQDESSSGDGSSEGYKSRYVPSTEVDELREQLEALKKGKTGSQSTEKSSGPSVCGDGQCDDTEKNRCNLDCGSSSESSRCGDGNCDAYERRERNCPVDCEIRETQSAAGTNSQQGSNTRFVPRSDLEKLQKEVDEFEANPPGGETEGTDKPAGPSVCGDGQCDDKEQGRCDRDCGGRPGGSDGGKIHCGDGECDVYEQRDKTCPLDCELTNY